MTATGIRKVGMPAELVKSVKDYAWENRLSASKVVREILSDYRKNPQSFSELTDTADELTDTLTVYVPDELWLATRDIAYMSGRMPLSVIIRKGLVERLRSEE